MRVGVGTGGGRGSGRSVLDADRKRPAGSRGGRQIAVGADVVVVVVSTIAGGDSLAVALPHDRTTSRSRSIPIPIRS